MLQTIGKNYINRIEMNVGALRVMQNPCFVCLHTVKHGSNAFFRLPVYPA